jgi:translation initiation factor 4E
MSDSLLPQSQDGAPTSSAIASRPTPSARMPSLNQLAARMSSNNTNSNANVNASNSNSSPSQPPSGTARHRLPTSLLARTSTTSVTTNSSAADSTAVQAPTTRSASPALSSQRSSSPAGSGREWTDVNAAPPGTELTAEHLERLNLGTAEGVGSNSTPSGEGAASTAASVSANGRSSSKPPSRGYKNVPTLEAITERLRKARALSVDGTEAPPQPPTAPATPNDTADPPQKEKEHPLQYPWYVTCTC